MNATQQQSTQAKKNPKPLSKEHLQEIRRQPRVTKEQFLDELLIFVEDCFEGTFKQTKDGISIRLPNGERFLINVLEVQKK